MCSRDRTTTDEKHRLGTCSVSAPMRRTSSCGEDDGLHRESITFRFLSRKSEELHPDTPPQRRDVGCTKRAAPLYAGPLTEAAARC